MLFSIMPLFSDIEAGGRHDSRRPTPAAGWLAAQMHPAVWRAWATRARGATEATWRRAARCACQAARGSRGCSAEGAGILRNSRRIRATTIIVMFITAAPGEGAIRQPSSRALTSTRVFRGWRDWVGPRASRGRGCVCGWLAPLGVQRRSKWRL